MSGIVGILNLDGAPVDRGLLQRLTDFLAFRGPDASGIWIGDNGCVGFGHTLFATTNDSEIKHQPFSLDENVWIVADARVDAQRDLIAELRLQGHAPPESVSDAELILRAYHVWGADCVEHLLGDFAFGIWDGSRRRLFCVRDQMGVKPFYYAHLGSLVIFSNTLDCIRQHPAVSDQLNDLAIADFLLFEHNRDSATTSFADIQRLPPAHRVTWSQAANTRNRYWTMPIDEPVFYRHADDYTDRFKELLRDAVSDRLHTDKVGIFMSGGLDSTTLAVVTRDILHARNPSFEVQAFTKINPADGSERHYAGLVANKLGIEINDCDWGDVSFDPDWEQSRVHTPEPRICPWTLPAFQRDFRKGGSFSRVFFYGEGPDNALHFEWKPFFFLLLRRRQYARLLQATLSTVRSQRALPFWGRIARRIKQVGAAAPLVPEPSLPVWLSTEFASRLHLRERFIETVSAAPLLHPLRPSGHESLYSSTWQDIFELLDPGAGLTRFELRYPYIDLRLLRYFLSIPALPWCRSKYLIRRAMRKALPDSVLRRPKTGVPMAPMMERLVKVAIKPMVPTPGLTRYVMPEKITHAADPEPFAFAVELRARALNYWLQNSRCFVHNDQSLAVNMSREDTADEARQ